MSTPSFMYLARAVFFMVLLVATAVDGQAQSQPENRWLTAGSFQNWYSSFGAEREHGDWPTQQHGWRWPAIHPRADMQAAKALWIGAKNVTDAHGTHWPVRVVHVGPRGSGAEGFFPTRFELIARRDRPVVTVDGAASTPQTVMHVDAIDPDLVPDAMIISEANTLLGITMKRRIMQFSQDYHDNYHIIEYTFTNTGRTGPGPDVTLPNQTLEDVYFFLQYRLSIAFETRYVIGNATGWGKNTMNDARGDGVEEDPPGERFRAQFAWHGHFPDRRVSYDNIGGPILPEALPATYISPADTLGRLGASQFAGVVTLHADTSPTNPDDDDAQPTTMRWLGSDASYQSNNSSFDLDKMDTEYGVMSFGRHSPRHARAVEPSGMPGFLAPTRDPSLGTPGGFSFANGFGPYILAPGESVRVVVAEGAAGLSREANAAIGRAWMLAGANRDAPITYSVHGTDRTMTKNEWVFTSRDSLFQTFHRAIANHESGYAIPRPPAPPRSFTVTSGPEYIGLEWQVDASEEPAWFEIYRAHGRADSTYTLIHTAGSEERHFNDVPPLPEAAYYYYIVAVGDGSANDGAGLTPEGRSLRSSRYFTQTYLPARYLPDVSAETGSLIATGIRLHDSYPNPFSTSATIRFELDQPAAITAIIYNVFGVEVARLANHAEYSGGLHDLRWSPSDLASGVYVLRITTGQESRTRKMMLIR